MDRASILEKVTQIVAENLEADISELSEETTFDELDADSFDKLELVTALEEEFDLTLDDEVLESIASIGDAVDAIFAAQN